MTSLRQRIQVPTLTISRLKFQYSRCSSDGIRQVGVDTDIPRNPSWSCGNSRLPPYKKPLVAPWPVASVALKWNPWSIWFRDEIVRWMYHVSDASETVSPLGSSGLGRSRPCQSCKKLGQKLGERALSQQKKSLNRNKTCLCSNHRKGMWSCGSWSLYQYIYIYTWSVLCVYIYIHIILLSIYTLFEVESEVRPHCTASRCRVLICHNQDRSSSLNRS